MCLSIPSKVTEIDEESNICTVDTMGVERKASLDLIDQPEGDSYLHEWAGIESHHQELKHPPQIPLWQTYQPAPCLYPLKR